MGFANQTWAEAQVGHAAWEAGLRQPEPSGQISFLLGPAVRGRETPQAMVGVPPGWTLWSWPWERDGR